jgi:hypothetical protein
MRKIRLLHTISKQQQNQKYLPNPEGFIEKGRYSIEEANG